MKLNELKVNGEIEYYGRRYLTLEVNPPNIVIKRIEGDYETITVNFYDLVLNPSFKAGKRLKNELNKETRRYISNLDNLSDSKRNAVSKRYELIKPVIVLEKAKGGDIKAYYHFIENFKDYIKEKEEVAKISQKDIIKRISEKQGLSVPTLYRYLYSFKQEEYQFENSGLEGLIPKHGQGQFSYLPS
jgi:putative transposase